MITERTICKLLTTLVVLSAGMLALASCSKMDDLSEMPVKKQAGTTIWEEYETYPSFPGGTQALMNYIKENTHWPEGCEESCVQGRVVVSFVIEKDGSITDAKVVKSLDPAFDKEALRVVSGMPKWCPGKFYGKTVRVRYSIPVPFRII